jgi:hypothetical protein
LLAAARRNARHSTGPRTPAARQNSKLNALKHGAYLREENRPSTLRALGEDPERLEALAEELRSAFGGGDALWEKQVEDLAWLYWRRERLERAQAGLKRRALQSIDHWQHRRAQEMARVTFLPSQRVMLDYDPPAPTDRGVALRNRLSYLEMVQEEVKQHTFRTRQYVVIEGLYRTTKGWRTTLIIRLLRRFSDPRYVEAQQAQGEQRRALEEMGFPCDPPGEPERRELLRWLGEEIAQVREEFAYAERANQEQAAFEREACLAPEGETWNMLLRQESALDRSIDRKVRILLRLRKESGNRAPAPADEEEGMPEGHRDNPGGCPEGATPAPAAVGKAGEELKMTERSGNVIENKRPHENNERRCG